MLNDCLWYDKLWGPSQREVTLFEVYGPLFWKKISLFIHLRLSHFSANSPTPLMILLYPGFLLPIKAKHICFASYMMIFVMIWTDHYSHSALTLINISRKRGITSNGIRRQAAESVLEVIGINYHLMYRHRQPYGSTRDIFPIIATI